MSEKEDDKGTLDAELRESAGLAAPPAYPGPQGFSYVDLLDHETVNAEPWTGGTGEKFFPLRPSASGKCTRALAHDLTEYYGKATYEKRKETAESKRLLDLGSDIERHLIRHFERACGKHFRIRYKQQVVRFYRLETKASGTPITHWIEGSTDSVFWSPEWRCVVDYKSKKDKFHHSHKTDWDATTDKLSRMKSVQKISETGFWVEDLPAFLDELQDEFFKDNFTQLNGYCCTDFMQEAGIDHGAIIQYNKNDSRLREIRFKPSMIVHERVRAKFQAALDAAAAGMPEAAPKDYVMGSIKCAFCPYAKQCWSGDALRAFFETFPRRRWPVSAEELAPEVQAAIDEFVTAEEAAAAGQRAEQIAIKGMLDAKVQRVKTDAGAIYEIKELKSPRPHFELRRTKI